MVEAFLAVAILTGSFAHQDAVATIDAAFEELDRRYFAMVMSTGDALLAAAADGPSDTAAQTSRCLALLTPVQTDLDTKALHREVRLVALVSPENRSLAFDVARETAQTQSANIALRLRTLELQEAGCLQFAAYRGQRQRTDEVAQAVQRVLSSVITNAPT